MNQTVRLLWNKCIILVICLFLEQRIFQKYLRDHFIT